MKTLGKIVLALLGVPVHRTDNDPLATRERRR